jgi:predicted lipoprotein with Yx(FWY)xxD motif
MCQKVKKEIVKKVDKKLSKSCQKSCQKSWEGWGGRAKSGSKAFGDYFVVSQRQKGAKMGENYRKITKMGCFIEFKTSMGHH